MAKHSPVKRQHPDYEKRAPQWERCRDAIEGEDAIKQAGVKYLPKLGGQASGMYEAYKMRASFFAASGRTVEGLVGAIMRKVPEIVWPEAHEELLEILGSRGETLNELILQTLDEVVGVGRYGVLVDAQPEFLTEANPEVGVQPFVSTYPAESIMNWVEDVVGARREPIEVTLRETETVYVEEGQDVVAVENTKFRRLMLGIPMPSNEDEQKLFDEEGPDVWLARFGLIAEDFADGLVYFQEIWVPDNSDSKDEYIREEVIVPRMVGARLLRSIPFVFFNPNGTKPTVEKPPLLDLVAVNISHYRNSADLEHGRHFTALPTAWAAGFDMKSEMTIGASQAWITDNEQAKAGFLEFTGKGLGHIAEGMKDKEGHMAVLGARLLEEQKTGVEAAETVRMRMAGEGSVLARMALAVSQGYTRVLEITADWIGLGDTQVDDAAVILNTDFQLQGLDPTMLTALMAAAQGGQISWSTFFWNVKKGEIIPPGVTEEEEIALIEEGNPGGDTLGDDENKGNPEDELDPVEDLDDED